MEGTLPWQFLSSLHVFMGLTQEAPALHHNMLLIRYQVCVEAMVALKRYTAPRMLLQHSASLAPHDI